MMAFPCFGVLILNFNGLRWLPGLLASLEADAYPRQRTYLVDNGSSDGSVDLVREHFPDVTVLELRRNLGYSVAYNMATRRALEDGCDWVVWLNNDTLVLPGWLSRMAEAAASDRRIGVMGPVFADWDSDGPSRFMRARHAGVVPFMDDASHPPVDCDWVEGSACAVSRSCVRAVGPLDPVFFMYWEEVDFCRRARREHWRVVIVPGSRVRHFGGGTAEFSAPNPLKLRNEFVTSLCDPGKPFLMNAARTGRLFLVKGKQAFQSVAPLSAAWRCVRVFLGLWGRTPTWYRKWARDRQGVHPPGGDARAGQLLTSQLTNPSTGGPVHR